MFKLTRRDAFRLGFMGGSSLLFSQFPKMPAWAITNRSPQIPRFQYPFRVPPTLKPVRSYEDGLRPLDVYEIELQKVQKELYPGLSTEFWSYNGEIPGPIIRQRGGFRTLEQEGFEDKGRSSLVRFINKLGKDDQGEDIKTTIHLHGMASLPQYDGYATDLICPEYYKDYFYPNDRAATIWYHDHAMDKTSRNVYMGLAGMYIVEDEEERQFNLPKGEYDVPLILQDTQISSKGDLVFNDRNKTNVYADIALVNGVPWPRMPVARRKYRFRILNASTSRGYQLVLSKKEGGETQGDRCYVIASDCGLLEAPVELKAPYDPLEIWPAERYEIVIDFRDYDIGDKVYLRSPHLRISSNVDRDNRIHTLMRFDVERDENDPSSLPDKLRDVEPLVKKLVEKLPKERRRRPLTPDRKFVFSRNNNQWTINNKTWNPDRVDANPEPGAIEIWELSNQTGGWIHPVHIHFADWQILQRDGQEPLPYEKGWKDVFRVGHFEKVWVIGEFGRRGSSSDDDKYIEGKFMFHCHNLVHEDHAMMTQFEIGQNGDSPLSAKPQPISEMPPL